MDAVLKMLSLEMNENRRNKVFTMIKQLKMRENSSHTDFSLNFYVLVVLNSMLPPSLTSCILNIVDIIRDAVEVTSYTTSQHDSEFPAFIYTDCIGKFEPATRNILLEEINLLRQEVIITFNLLGNYGISLLCMSYYNVK